MTADKHQKVAHKAYRRVEHFQIGKRRVGLGAPLQARFLGEKCQPQVERVRGWGHGCFVDLEPGLPLGDFFLSLPLLDGGL